MFDNNLFVWQTCGYRFPTRGWPLDTNALYCLIGEKIRKARERVGMSQGALARHLGMSRTSIVNIEAGRQRLPLHILWRISHVVGTEAGMLLPQHAEYHAQLQPLSLNADTVAKIEKAANGDPFTKQFVAKFISKVKAEGIP